jgi:hypothetical protein
LDLPVLFRFDIADNSPESPSKQDRPVLQPTEWHASIQNTLFSSEAKTVLSAKIKKLEKAISTKQAVNGTLALETSLKIKLEDYDEVKAPVSAFEVPPMLLTQACHHYEFSYSVAPFAGASCFVTVVSGSCFALAADIGVMITHGFSVDRLHKYVDSKVFLSSIDKACTCVLETGSTLFVPFGYIPVLLGFCRDEISDDTSFFSAVLNYEFGMPPPNVGSDVKLEVFSAVSKSLATTIQKPVKSSAAEAEAWMKTWLPVSAVKESEDKD